VQLMLVIQVGPRNFHVYYLRSLVLVLNWTYAILLVLFCVYIILVFFFFSVSRVLFHRSRF
jgi:hypothetical protein